jgi:hypothetical protein
MRRGGGGQKVMCLRGWLDLDQVCVAVISFKIIWRGKTLLAESSNQFLNFFIIKRFVNTKCKYMGMDPTQLTWVSWTKMN